MLTMFTLLFKFHIELLVCVIKYEDDILSSNKSKKCFDHRAVFVGQKSNVQKWWEEEDDFKSEPGENPPKLGELFFGNLPFPYMNGYLHLGHVSSLSKLAFAAAIHRFRGANGLPLSAFHCTICLSKPLSINSLEKFNNLATLMCSPAYKKKMLWAPRVLSTMIPTQTIRLIINKKGKRVRPPQNQIGRLISERFLRVLVYIK